MTYDERLEQINALLPALSSPALLAHINGEIASLTVSLIETNDEQTRGRLKALRDLINLPEALQYERDGLAAELTAQAASA